SAEHIEKMAEAILDSPVFGVNARSKLVTNGHLIKRIFLTSSKSFKIAKRKIPLPFGIQESYIQIPMPKFIWVCELSTALDYPKRQVVGEIIFDATANQRDRFSFIAFHYP